MKTIRETLAEIETQFPGGAIETLIPDRMDDECLGVIESWTAFRWPFESSTPHAQVAVYESLERKAEEDGGETLRFSLYSPGWPVGQTHV